MAVVLAFRLAIAAGASTRLVRSSQGTSGPSYGQVLEYFRSRGLYDFGSSDLDLSEAMTAYSSYDWQVATFSGSFELRKLHVIWSEADASVPTDDSRVCTFHLAKVASGSVVNTWDSTDFALVQSTLLTWWGAIKSKYSAHTVLDRMKLYKDGPAIEPPQVPVYDADLNVAGTEASNPPMPPQVALSVTEIAGSKRYWGRFYLPAPTTAVMGTFARLDSTAAGVFANATDTWYEALKAGGLHPVVYRQALPVRPTAEEKRNGVTPGSLPARDATAWDVEKIQIDDVFDVIRSRRYKTALLRTQRDIA